MTPPDHVAWQPFQEPLSSTLKRTIAIAIVVSAVLAWRWGRWTHWPTLALLILWPSLGGHYVDLMFLNYLRPRSPAARAVQLVMRGVVWFLGGVGLAVGMWGTAMLIGSRTMHRPAWWVAGLAFIGIELIAHVVLQLRGMPSVYNGRG